MSFLILAAFVLLLAIGVPLFAVLGITTILCLLLLAGMGTDTLAQEIYFTVEEPVIFAIPFFILAGAIMTHGSIAKRLVAIARAVVGPLPGGLGAATVVACMFFAAISGSSPVTVVAIGGMMLPALLDEKYPEKFSLGLVTSAGSLGILIPPSIPMIIFAVVVSPVLANVTDARVDVEQLFLAGVGPGILIGFVLIGYSIWVRRHVKYVPPPRVRGVTRYIEAPGGTGALIIAEDTDLEPRWYTRFVEQGTNGLSAFLRRHEYPRRLFGALGSGVFALLLPVLILGGIYGGWYTATEASALAVVYAFIIEQFIHRELDIVKLLYSFVESTVVMGALLVIITSANAFNGFLEIEKVPDMLAHYIQTVVDNPFAFLILLNLLLLAVGCVMDIMSAILILAPLMAPIAVQFGIDPLHLGIVFIVNLEIGYLTPPIGINLFVSSSMFERSLPMVIKSVVPFLFLLLGCLAVTVYWEPLSLFLVDLKYPDRPRVERPVEGTPTPAPTNTPSGIGDWFNQPKEGGESP